MSKYKVENPEYFKDESKLLYEYKSEKITHLFDAYKKNRFHARVIYMNDTTNYEHNTLWLFNKKNGDFTIVLFCKKYGISITNKRYSHEKRVFSIIYKGGKFWCVNNTSRYKTIRPLTLFQISMLMLHDKVLVILKERFTWVRFMCEHNVLTNVSFNTIVTKKLYSLKKALTYQYGTTYPVSKLIHTAEAKRNVNLNFKKMGKYLKNIESLKAVWLNTHSSLFIDSVRMAKMVDKQINCSWSLRRLKEEHDNMSKEISEIIYSDSDRELNIKNIFKEFEKYSNFNMVKTTKGLYLEGKKQSHCVATYVSSVDRGGCAIYSVNDFTLEIREHWDSSGKLMMAQCKGYLNCEPPELIKTFIKDKILSFNETKKSKDSLSPVYINAEAPEHLPF
tara:strand:- start:367 stop:1539 length:1173 start_codon:yes stop_codon:yes gene_type:complete